MQKHLGNYCKNYAKSTETLLTFSTANNIAVLFSQNIATATD